MISLDVKANKDTFDKQINMSNVIEDKHSPYIVEMSMAWYVQTVGYLNENSWDDTGETGLAIRSKTS